MFFSWIFICISKIRRKWQTLRSYKSKIPIIIIGNINVGGTGKTLTVIALCKFFLKIGKKPIVISRGFRGKSRHYPLKIRSNTPVLESGDEPLIIYEKFKGRVQVIVDPNRVRGVKFIEERCKADLIISDDGLQHYNMGRMIEIVMVDLK